jgi:hypothetical protein
LNVPEGLDERGQWAILDLPAYAGLDLLGGNLPREREAWPKFATRRTLDASGDFYDLATEEIAEYAAGKTWVWPERDVSAMSTRMEAPREDRPGRRGVPTHTRGA